VADARRVLVLGGGDGLAVREILKYPRIAEITLVDLDPEMTRLFSANPLLTALNQGSLRSPKVKVINADAFLWIDSSSDVFDFVVVDFPDPTNYSLGKLYTTVFFTALGHHLSEQGAFVVQSTSPMFARRSFWCIEETIKQSGFRTFPYHAYVPSFGEWGFVLASRQAFTPPATLPEGLRFLVAGNLPTLFEFPTDMSRVEMPANRLNDQILVRTLEAEWREITR
jgi:spermidine synthase